MVPQIVLAAAPGHRLDQPLVADIALAEGGVLAGRVVTAEGVAVPQAPVAVLADGREVIRLAAAEDGSFAVGGLQGGVYEVAAPGQHAVYRLWAPGTAPPAAGQSVTLVSAQEAMPAPYGYPPPPPPGPPAPPPASGPFGRAAGWISDHPFLTAGIVATAIAVPIAVAEADDAS
jgi:hypothetical protein